ncbi:MAG TPA: metallophosphoesterase [Bacteroidaceae bacterium]|nr:metallophosphoesterase [Bacteroidaceae bacterium]
MGNKIFEPVILILFFTLFLPACEKMEIRGFIVSYETADQRFEQSIEWNNHNGFREITTDRDNYLLYSMGDSHVGGTANLDLFFREAQNEDPVAAVMVGDLTNGHEANYIAFREHLPDKDSLLTFPIAGNHDIYFGGWKHYHSIFGSSTYTFIINTPAASDLFICLDSGGGTLGTRQLDWLGNLLETTRNDYRYCIIFTHNNLFRLRPTTSTNPFVEEIHVLLDLFLRYNVDMVVTAHDHKRNTGILGNTTHIIMDALSDEYDHAGYMKIFINTAAIEYVFVNL